MDKRYYKNINIMGIHFVSLLPYIYLLIKYEFSEQDIVLIGVSRTFRFGVSRTFRLFLKVSIQYYMGVIYGSCDLLFIIND